MLQVLNQRSQWEKISLTTGMGAGFPQVVQAGGSPFMCLELSPSGNVMAVGDADGQLHLMSTDAPDGYDARARALYQGTSTRLGCATGKS